MPRVGMSHAWRMLAVRAAMTPTRLGSRRMSETATLCYCLRRPQHGGHRMRIKVGMHANNMCSTQSNSRMPLTGRIDADGCERMLHTLKQHTCP